MRLLFIFLAFCSVQFTQAQADTVQKRVEGRRNSPEQQKKPYLILISVDGFRHDYAEKHKAGYLAQLGRENVKAAYMQPSFPSLTFPNHYTLVTGLYPSHHGLVDNRFFSRERNEPYSMSKATAVTNGDWYGGTPLWVLAEQQQMVTASFYWVGSEAPIRGIRPTYYYKYNEQIPIDRRIQTVVNWLQLPEAQRPHFISFYFPEVDHAGHDFGPDAPETAAAVRFVDSAVNRLMEAVSKTGLDVNFIFVADHGMTAIDTAHPLQVPEIDSSKAIIAGGSELVHIYVKEAKRIRALHQSLKKDAKHYRVLLKNETPRRWHYRSKDDRFNRIGDIILVSDAPYVFAKKGSKPDPGAHGFDPYKVTDMNTVFYAWGPAFQKKKHIGAIKNVEVFPIVAKILGLSYNTAIDGTAKTARKILVK